MARLERRYVRPMHFLFILQARARNGTRVPSAELAAASQHDSAWPMSSHRATLPCRSCSAGEWFPYTATATYQFTCVTANLAWHRMGTSAHLTKFDTTDSLWPHVGRQIATERYACISNLPILGVACPIAGPNPAIGGSASPSEPLSSLYSTIHQEQRSPMHLC